MQVRDPKAANGRKNVRSYKDLLVWQKRITLVKKTYELTQTFPETEKFGLVSHMRRAAVSIPSNIAEGQARHAEGVYSVPFAFRGVCCRIGNAGYSWC